MVIVSKKMLFGAALAAVVTASLATSFGAGAETAVPGAPGAKAPAAQAQKPPVSPIPAASGKIKQKPVVIKDHAWVQFYNVDTGEHTGCHDIDNQMSCDGSCPCN